MNCNETVEKVMVLLKEKEVCFSNQKSHRDCYESLGLFIKQRNEGYSEAIRESWLADIKNELSRQSGSVWVQYAYQLEKMDSTESISDRRCLRHTFVVKRDEPVDGKRCSIKGNDSLRLTLSIG